jgi:hypothetical protein
MTTAQSGTEIRGTSAAGRLLIELSCPVRWQRFERQARPGNYFCQWRRYAMGIFCESWRSSEAAAMLERNSSTEDTCTCVGLRPTGLSSPALQTRPPALTRVEKRINTFPMPTLSRRTLKNKPAHAHESSKQRLKRLLRQMVRNEFSILLNEVTNAYAATPARRRLIE